LRLVEPHFRTSRAPRAAVGALGESSELAGQARRAFQALFDRIASVVD